MHAVDAVYAAGEPVGLIAGGAYGHHIRRDLGFAYLAPEHCAPGTRLEVRVIGDLRPARVLGEPLYDPGNLRLRQ